MPNKFYAEIFNHSGASYHRAMQLHPRARDEEFNAVRSLLKLQSGDCLVDVPAGGGYLHDYLPASINYSGLEFSNGFGTHGDVGQCSETNLPPANASMDAAVCLAALHHVENKLEFFTELARCLKPNGRLVVADVVQHSKEAEFLNGFVNTWNSLGHDGDFINPERDKKLLRQAGFATEFETKHYCWNFESYADCQEYLRLLFSLDKQPPQQALEGAIEKLGGGETNSGFHLNWALGFMIATVL